MCFLSVLILYHCNYYRKSGWNIKRINRGKKIIFFPINWKGHPTVNCRQPFPIKISIS
jgi:hypothetical protein